MYQTFRNIIFAGPTSQSTAIYGVWFWQIGSFKHLIANIGIQASISFTSILQYVYIVLFIAFHHCSRYCLSLSTFASLVSTGPIGHCGNWLLCDQHLTSNYMCAIVMIALCSVIENYMLNPKWSFHQLFLSICHLLLSQDLPATTFA